MTAGITIARQEGPSVGLNPTGQKLRTFFKWIAVSTFSIIVIKNSSPKPLEGITLTLDAYGTDRSLNVAGYHLYSFDNIIGQGGSRTFCWAAYLSEKSDPRVLYWTIGTKSFRFGD
jgi:hypothetical protein